MSVVVAIKDNGSIYLGADSQITSGSSRKSLSNPNNFKIWQVKDIDRCMIGHVGVVRDANVVKTSSRLVSRLDAIDDKIDFDFMVNSFVPNLFKILEEHRLLIKETDDTPKMNSAFIFAYKDLLYHIYADGCVVEIDDCVAIGSGSSEAIGSLLSTEGQETRERIIKAIKSSATNDLYVYYPIVLGGTHTKEFEVICEDQFK